MPENTRVKSMHILLAIFIGVAGHICVRMAKDIQSMSFEYTSLVSHESQIDADSDGIADVYDDSDRDGIADASDATPYPKKGLVLSRNRAFQEALEELK